MRSTSKPNYMEILRSIFPSRSEGGKKHTIANICNWFCISLKIITVGKGKNIASLNGGGKYQVTENKNKISFWMDAVILV